MNRALVGAFALSLGMALMPVDGSGQGLADFDYENLSLRGFSLEGGYIWPTRVDPTYTLGMRLDLGYLGPGLRIVPGISYWSSRMKAGEVAELEAKVDELILGEIPPTPGWTGTDLGIINWSDLVLSLDGHFVWAIPLDLLSYVGGGISAHIMNGEGAAIAGTFVEDLLDTVTAGINFHAGLEYPWSDWLRMYGTARYEILEDLRYSELRAGVQIMVGSSMPQEERAR
jgi:hypothetical protein